MKGQLSVTGELAINLAALNSNWQKFNSLVGQAECGAVVKANAYGLGVLPVVKSLLAAGCNTFFVATIDEAIELREGVVGSYRIVVLGGQAASFSKECLHYKLMPVLTNYEQIAQWPEDKPESKVATIIKFDSGMHRFGLMPEDIDQLLQKPDLLKRLSPTYFMSHLACADESEHPLNQSQLNLFSNYYRHLQVHIPQIKASLANSSGCFLGEGYHFDLCRPGIGLYGGNPTPKKTNPVQAVVELILPIMQIKILAAGESIGYGADYYTKAESRIAIVFGGYADGLFRILSSGAQGYIEGQSVPMVGRVSMDAIAFDVTSISEEKLNVCRGIEMIGPHQSVDDLAQQAQTISYEVLTSLGMRYHRQYLPVLSEC